MDGSGYYQPVIIINNVVVTLLKVRRCDVSDTVRKLVASYFVLIFCLEVISVVGSSVYVQWENVSEMYHGHVQPLAKAIMEVTNESKDNDVLDMVNVVFQYITGFTYRYLYFKWMSCVPDIV